MIGVLLTKSLVGAPMGRTLRDLYRMRIAKIVVPIYASPDEPLFEAIARFEGRKTHVCFVYESRTHV